VTRTYDCRDHAEREQGIAAAIDAVRRGDLVVLPTDTVYGIGADAFAPTAVQTLLAAKRRGPDMPVPVLVGSWHTIDGLVTSVRPTVRQLVEAFWPGGLTLVVEHAPSLAWDLGETGGTVAVRMPLHPVALEVLNATGPMAVSSANVSGQPPATTAEEAREQLGWLVEVYLEAGPCGDPVASTILDVTGEVPKLLRPGAVTIDQLREVVEVDA
jgi:tRNA threonylcarbamoyl adenosine modification protein (Sua5/YciO/YrdC/YwlC family)